jgi:uncharacterized caspase-like protein
MYSLRRIATLLVVLSFVTTPSLAQDKRIALVIGNSDYKHTPRLANPGNDADDMAARLKQVGFDVIVGRDLDKAAMDRTIRDFAEKLAGADAGLFFYAGHGLQVNGQNYLVPTDAKLRTAAAIDFEMVRLDLVHRTMERETRTNILIMDACRDNPLARNLARALGTRSGQIGRGLAAVESGEGTLISFSTQPGNVALDGTGRNSPFAAAFLKHMATAGEDLLSILINVRNDVMRATARRQIPWEHSAMTAKFHFILPPPPAAPQSGPDIELEFWASVKDSTSPAVLGTYLERYPDGEFAPIARALIEHYERQLKAEVAAREQERKRLEEEKKAAEVKRLEDERRAREVALAEERRRAEEAKNVAEAKLVEEKQRAEWQVRTEELKKALEEVRLAREAAAAAEKQRLAAAEEAKQATKAAEKAIANKRESEKTGDAAKIAALPKLEKPSVGSFDGTWYVQKEGSGCGKFSRSRNIVFVANGVVSGRGPIGSITGTVSMTGQFRFAHASHTGDSKTADGFRISFQGSLRGNGGSGTFQHTRAGSRCRGTFTATRG